MTSQASRRKQQIINELKKAKYCIWIAEAWFDHKDIYDILIERAKEGLNVEIILLGDETKFDNDALNYNDFMDAGGELYYLNEDDCKNIRYKEFCIVDFKTVIYGAHKKTKYSEKKNITIFKNFEALANAFTDEYMEMKNQYSKSVY